MDDILGEKIIELSYGVVSSFQRHKAEGSFPTDFYTVDEQEATYQVMIEVTVFLEKPQPAGMGRALC